MGFVTEYGMFFLKVVTMLVAVLLVIRVIVRAAIREPSPGQGRLKVTKLNRAYQRLADRVRARTLSRAEYKRLVKQRKAERKQERRADPTDDSAKPRAKMFVLRFDGDLRATAVENLRREVTAILAVAEAKAGDEVLLRLDSSGGLVHAYGFAASQLDRLRSRELRLTVAVDKIAASGGYMMACVADRLVAAPFAVVGSIGVVAMLPNLHRLLKKHDVDVELITAGEYKRTLTVLGENTEKGRAKFTEQIEDAHRLFKDFIAKHRPDVDLDRIGTGEHWYATQAMELGLGLVDEVSTSDDLLLEALETKDLYEIRYLERRTLGGRLTSLVDATARRLSDSGWKASQDSRYV